MQELVSSEALNNEEEIIVFEENLKGPKGDKGDKGDDGYTPKKGVDYFTENDKQELIEAVTEDASSEFVQIVNSKTTEFNNNATSKTESFNSNATSKETAYNENATNKLNEYNENHTIKMTAYNENSAEKLAVFNENAAEKIEEYDDHIEELDNIVSKKTASGESISIDDALEYKVFGAKVDGNAEQTTTTGKNYFNAYAINNTAISVENDGQTIAIDVVTSGNGAINTHKTLAELCPNLAVGDQVVLRFNRNLGITHNAFIYLGSPIDEVWAIGNSKTITAEMLNCEVMLYGNRYIDGETEQCIITDFTIMKSSETDTTFEPFTNNEPSPNPDYPQEIETITNSVNIIQTGKNLFDSVNYGNLAFWNYNVGQITTMTENERYLSAYCRVVAGKTYTVSRKIISNRFAIAACNEIPNINTTALVLAASSSAKSLTVTVPDNYNYLVLYLQNDGVYTDVGLQIEEGSLATDYEEYKSNEYDIDLQDNELVKLTDDIKDIIEIDKLGNVSLLKNTTKKIFNGTENWFVFDNQNLTNCVRFRFGYDINNINALCDRLQLKLTNEYWTNDVECLGYSDTGHYIVGQIKKSRLDENASLQSFKDFLAENNLTVYHKLTEPTTSSLGQLTNFKTFEGVNHFFLEANLSTNFEIKYVQDLQKVISKQQEEIDELKTLLSSTATSALLLDNYESDLINEIESEVEQ